MSTVFEATVTATFDNVAGGNYQALFDFGDGTTRNKIWFGSLSNTNTIILEVFQNGFRYSLQIPNAIDEGVETSWNVSIDDTGTYTILKDGISIGSQNFGVAAIPNDVPRSNNLIGESSFNGDDPLIGTVSSINVETTLTNGFDIYFSDTQNAVGAFDGTDRDEVLNAANSSGADSLAGDGGDDSIYGGGGNDTLAGDAGNDLVIGGAGADSIDGGVGDDILHGDDFLAGPVTVTNADFDAGSDGWTTTGAGTYVYTVDGNDAMAFNAGNSGTGGTAQQTIATQAGGRYALSLDAYEFDISGGSADHTLLIRVIDANGQVIAEQTEVIANETGRTITVDFVAPTDTVTLRFSNPTSTGTNDSDLIIDNVSVTPVAPSGGGDDTLSGGAGNDALFGGAGNDSLAAGDGNDTVEGGAGDDNISAFQGDDTISGGDGADTIFSLGGGNDTIDGGADADTIIIRTLSDATVRGGEATTTGTDTDRLDVAEGATPLTLDFSGAEAGTIGDGVSTVTFTEIEQVFLGEGDDTINTGAQTDALTVDGGGGDDVFNAATTSGANTFDGQGGDDTIHGGSGNETLRGGSGRDLIFGADGDDLINAGGDADTVYGGSGNDTIDGAQDDDLIDGGSGNDLILGGDGSDTIIGGTGADNIQGGGDADTFLLANGFGNDTIGGGETATTGTDSDVIDASALTGTGVTVNVTNGAGTLRDGTDTVTFSEIEGFILTDQDDTFTAFGTSAVTVDSGAGNDLIREGNGGNTIDAGTGNDTIVAGLGTSTITGGEDVGGGDTDILDFRVANDAVTIIFDGAESGTYADNDGDSGTFSEIESFRLTSGNDAVDASLDTAGVFIDGGGGADTIIGGSGNDVITGGGPMSGDPGDSLSGGAGNDIILGDAGDDTIDGGSGSDFIAGGAGNDLLTGGEGDDYFVHMPGDGLDTITDFNIGNTGTLDDGDVENNDFIDLSGYYDHISELYADQADDGVLNQSNTMDTRGNAVDYSDNTRFDTNGTPNDEGIRFTGATADRSFFTVENTGVVCFTSGTLIATPKGEVPIETLKPGDLVLTRDNGPQPLIWIGRRQVGRAELARNENLRPIEIKPTLIRSHSPLVVSRQHGVLVRRDGEETLVRAIHLARLPRSGARIMQGCRGVTYVHLMFEAHQIVFAAGAPSESFYPGPQAIGSLAVAARDELFSLFPTLPQARVRDFAPFKDLGEAVVQGA
jgi:Ca2+-binding RTX toxin-like protein